MGQCILLDCLWCNCFGVLCGGLAINYLCCRCWILKPEGQASHNPNCFDFGWSGLGGNCLCYGYICCAPDGIKNWSKSIK